MSSNPPIIIQPTTQSKMSEVDFEHLEFGRYISDHMLMSKYSASQWNNTSILPFGPLFMSPSMLALHYGQAVFEGMKAFRRADGKVAIFRIEKHYQRFLRTLERMSMPAVPEAIFCEGLCRLVEFDHNWVPKSEGSALYLRPFMFASEERFGVKIADEYLFIIFTGPVGPYYAKPLNVKVETHFSRAAKGGTGYAKCAGNYGGAFYPTQMAREEGYDQVIWTDPQHHQTIEESGTMNLMFVIDGKVVTPPTSDSILDGVTRDSILTLAPELGYEVEVRPVSIDEMAAALSEGRLTEAFGAGTAAVVSPIQSIGIEGRNYQLPAWDESSFMMKVKERLRQIRMGLIEDTHGWITVVN